MASGRDADIIQPKDRADWRRWLESNHDRTSGVWVVYYKRSSGKQALTYEEAVEEALNFGWIDGLVNRLDEVRYKQLFSPRKKGGTWARSNKERVARLIEQGQMTPAGMARIEEAKMDGSWSQLDSIEEMVVPAELAEALSANPEAESNFRALSDSKKKQLLWWLATAKRLETRSRRIANIVRLAAEGGSMDDAARRRESP